MFFFFADVIRNYSGADLASFLNLWLVMISE